MKCDLCGVNEATVHLTEVVNDQKSEMHLCVSCAEERSGEIKTQFGLKEFLSGLAEVGMPVEAEGRTRARCATCGMTLADFKRVARLGCSDCYGSFRAQLGPLLRRIHGSTVHVGKSPLPEVKPLKEDAKEVRTQLALAIQEERFEDAARLRDKIRALEKR